MNWQNGWTETIRWTVEGTISESFGIVNSFLFQIGNWGLEKNGGI